MSRPIKVGLDYFPLDVNLSEDVELLEAEFGLVGFAILIKLWQKIYSNGYFTDWNEDNILLFSRKINHDITIINNVVNCCLRRSIFNNELFNKYKILTSSGTQKRYIKACTDSKRKSVSFIKEFILVNSEFIKLITEFIELNHSESTQRKEEEKKEEEIITNNYKKIFDYYQTLNLIKHKNYTKTMSEAIRLFIKNTKSTEEECMEALKKHSSVVENSKKEEYPIKARTFSEFFGQKVFGGKELIGEQYINGGKYFNYTPKKVIVLPEYKFYVPIRERAQNE